MNQSLGKVGVIERSSVLQIGGVKVYSYGISDIQVSHISGDLRDMAEKYNTFLTWEKGMGDPVRVGVGWGVD